VSVDRHTLCPALLLSFWVVDATTFMDVTQVGVNFALPPLWEGDAKGH
jgi:hypothetical protein